MQINVQMGYSLPRLVDLIIEEKPDIICSQEIFQTSKSISIEDSYQTLTHIQKAGKFKRAFFSPTWSSKVFDTQLDFGNAIFSKFPIVDKQTIFISKSYVPNQTAQNWEFNARNLQLCTIDAGGKLIKVANHQGFIIKNEKLGGPETIKYTQKVADSLRPYIDSMIFCCDLNIVKESHAFLPIKELGFRNLTSDNNIKTTLSAAHRALNRDSVACDYIFCSHNIKIKNFSVSEQIVSDHKALILEFDIWLLAITKEFQVGAGCQTNNGQHGNCNG